MGHDTIPVRRQVRRPKEWTRKILRIQDILVHHGYDNNKILCVKINVISL